MSTAHEAPDGTEHPQIEHPKTEHLTTEHRQTEHRQTEHRQTEHPQTEQDPLRREVDELVGRWLTVPDVAELLHADVTRVRSLLDDGSLVAVRRGRPRVLSVPAALVEPEPLPGLAGTLTVLADSGYDELETLRWLFSPQDSLDGDSPVVRLRAGQRGEIRRLAQALAF